MTEYVTPMQEARNALTTLATNHERFGRVVLHRGANELVVAADYADYTEVLTHTASSRGVSTNSIKLTPEAQTALAAYLTSDR